MTVALGGVVSGWRSAPVTRGITGTVHQASLSLRKRLSLRNRLSLRARPAIHGPRKSWMPDRVRH